MRRTFTLLATAAFVMSLGGAADAKSCKDASGKYTKCPAAAAAPAATPAAKSAAATPAAKPAAASSTKTASASAPKNCKKGKPCGNSCIAMSDTCHK